MNSKEQLMLVIAEMVSFVSEGFHNLGLYWKTLNEQTCTAGFGKKMLK